MQSENEINDITQQDTTIEVTVLLHKLVNSYDMWLIPLLHRGSHTKQLHLLHLIDQIKMSSLHIKLIVYYSYSEGFALMITRIHIRTV